MEEKLARKYKSQSELTEFECRALLLSGVGGRRAKEDRGNQVGRVISSGRANQAEKLAHSGA